MSSRLIECVPNFSEGRDRRTVESIASSIGRTPGAEVLDVEMDADHHRSVITFAGRPEAVVEAALAGVGKAVELIDLNRHRGAHPRIGAADVVPFIPVAGLSMEECVRLARAAGTQIWERFGVPVYFYEAAATSPERRNLAEVRRGNFEGLRSEAATCAARRPDVGGPELHPTAGATAVGARKFLIAYNVNLASRDVHLARRIAGKIRESSGGFRFVKALGLELERRGLVQVSMNLTDYEQIPVECLLETIENEAAAAGVRIESCEIVGLVPAAAFDLAPEFYRRAANFTPQVILENRLRELELV